MITLSGDPLTTLVSYSDGQEFFMECCVHEVWSSILGGVNKIFFSSNQNFLCTLGPVKGIKTFSKIGCRCYEIYSHVFTPSEIFFNIPRVG